MKKLNKKSRVLYNSVEAYASDAGCDWYCICTGGGINTGNSYSAEYRWYWGYVPK